jgi:N-succinyldiaminopimelate aminotransferase
MNPAVQATSEAAWRDEAHVVENRVLYRAKFMAALPMLGAPLETALPDGGFYFWIRTPISDTEFARGLYRDYNVTVLPGSFLAREAHGANPGRNHVRVALVARYEECIEGIDRIRRFAEKL